MEVVCPACTQHRGLVVPGAWVSIPDLNCQVKWAYASCFVPTWERVSPAQMANVSGWRESVPSRADGAGQGARVRARGAEDQALLPRLPNSSPGRRMFPSASCYPRVS